jgi:hypothetical protein
MQKRRKWFSALLHLSPTNVVLRPTASQPYECGLSPMGVVSALRMWFSALLPSTIKVHINRCYRGTTDYALQAPQEGGKAT